MVSPSLGGCFAKLERADEQLDLLENEVRQWVEGEPYEIPHEPEKAPNGWSVWRYTNVRPVPARFGIILGEVVHDLRSSLDHLVYQMVLRSKRKPYSGNYFPIYFVRDHPDSSQPSWVRDAPKDLQGVKKKYWTLFERLQPYRRGHRAEFHPLALLNDLSITDKHRVIYLAALNAPHRVAPHVRINTYGYSGFQAMIRFGQGLVDEGAEAFEFGIVSAPYGAPPHVQVEINPPIQVLFSDRALRLYHLKRIRLFIARGVLRRFAPLFGEAVPAHLLQHPEKPSGFRVLGPNEASLWLSAPEKTPAIFGDWRVWFDAGRFPDLIPRWYFGGPDPSFPPSNQVQLELPARDLRTAQEFRGAIAAFLPEGVVEQVLEHFAPEARDTPLGFGVFPS